MVRQCHPLATLYKRFGKQVAFDLGILLEAKVAFNIHEGAWRWPRRRHRVTLEVMEILKTLLLEINVGMCVNRVSHHLKR